MCALGHPDRAGGAAPCVSIVLPTYNSARTLRRAVDSVVAQTLADWELIIVDDGSTDDTPRHRAAFAEALGDRLTWVRTANRGPGAARNTGIDVARGRYLAFLDADDEFLPQRLAWPVALAQAQPQLGLVFSDYAYVDAQGVRHASVFSDLAPFIRELPCERLDASARLCGPELLECMSARYVVSTITGLVRRDVLGGDVRFPTDLRYCEEWLFFLEVCRRTRGGYIDAPLALHHHTPGSLSRSSVMRNLEHRIRALQRIRASGAVSRAARSALRGQLVEAHRQLGFDHYKSGQYAIAAGHFARTLALAPGLRPGAQLCQALLRLATGVRGA